MTARSKRKAPTRFVGAIVVLWLASVVLAVYGATGWIVSMWSISQPLAIMLALAFGTAPLVAAAMTEPAIRGGGLAAWAAVLVFCGMDAAGNTHAFWTFESVAKAEENKAAAQAHALELVAYEADRKAATDTRNAANAALLAIPTATSACEGLGPVNCKARLEGLAADRAGLVAQRDAAEETLAALAKPTPPAEARMLPAEVSGTLHTLLSFALVAGFLGTHNARRKAGGVKAAPARRPARRPRPKAAAKPVAVIPGSPPRLVVDNTTAQLELFN